MRVKWFAALALAALVLALWTVSVLGGASLVASGHRAATVSYTVQPGDSLWTIAESISGGDPRDTMGAIEELNHLDGATIQAGQTLLLPAA